MMLGRKTRAAYISILRITSGTIYALYREGIVPLVVHCTAGRTLYRWLYIVPLVAHCIAGSTLYRW
jgi:hypothetical protein